MARVVLAVLLAAMATGQLSDVGGFVDIVATYEVGGTFVAGLLASGLIVAELGAAAGLLARDGRRRSVASSIALGVAVAWTLLGVQAFARGLAIDNCGCFGVHAAQQLRWWVLVEDAEFIILAWWVRARSALPSADHTGQDDEMPAAVS